MTYVDVSARELAAMDGLHDWRLLLRALHADFRAGSYPAAAELVAAIAAAAEAAGHHPDLDIRHPDRVRVVLTTHATGGLTAHDVDLARQISILAAASGALAEPGKAQAIELAINTERAGRIRPFWAAILGYVDDDGYLVDPLRFGPPLWFQEGESFGQARAFHVDISVADDRAQGRVEAALAAGGSLVTDRFAPSWWVLADADGNQACISTWQNR